MKPVEGTILTVSRGAAIGAKKKAEQQMMLLKSCVQPWKVLKQL